MILDLDDPTAPRPLGRTTYAPAEEGSAHSVDLADGGRVLIQADEVFDVEFKVVRVESPPSLAGPLRAGGALPAPPYEDTTSVTAELAYLGRGCPAGDWVSLFPGPGAEALDADDPYPIDPGGRIALLDRGACPFATKVARAEAAGAVGAVFVNRVDNQLTPISLDRGPLGAFQISRAAGERLKAELATGRPVEVTLAADLREYQDFGGLRFWDIADPAQPRALGSVQTPRSRVDRAHGPAEPGQFSVHNPVVQGDLLFVSWYSDGVRVLDTGDPGAPSEVAAWIPTGRDMPGAVRNSLGEGPTIWGIAVEGNLVVASDVNSARSAAWSGSLHARATRGNPP